MNISKLILGLLMFCLMTYAYAEPPGGMVNKMSKLENKYTFIFFYKTQNQSTIQLKKVFDEGVSKLENVQSANFDVNDAAAKPLIKKYKLERAPMPFVLVIAPNGAVTGGFPTFTDQQLKDSVVSVGATNCLKALQDNKLVVLCLRNKQTTHNKEVSQTVNSFKTDPRFSKATQVVLIDPSDTREYKFLNQLNLNPSSTEATTVLISPPATVIGKFQGAITKEQLVASIQKATSGCCGGKCCSGHCKCHEENLS